MAWLRPPAAATWPPAPAACDAWPGTSAWRTCSTGVFRPGELKEDILEAQRPSLHLEQSETAFDHSARKGFAQVGQTSADHNAHNPPFGRGRRERVDAVNFTQGRFDLIGVTAHHELHLVLATGSDALRELARRAVSDQPALVDDRYALARAPAL